VVAYWFVLTNVQTLALRPVYPVPWNAKTDATTAIARKRAASHACRVARSARGNVVIISVQTYVESYATGQDVTNRATESWFVEDAVIFVAVYVENCVFALFATRTMVAQLQIYSSAMKMKTIRYSFSLQTANTFLQWQDWTGKNFIIRTVKVVFFRRHCPVASVTLANPISKSRIFKYLNCRFRNFLIMSKKFMKNVEPVIFVEF